VRGLDSCGSCCDLVLVSCKDSSELLSCSSLCAYITISYKDRLMLTYIIHTNLLGLCYSMFQPWKGHRPGVRLIYFHCKVNKIGTIFKIQFSDQLLFYIWSIVFLSYCGNVSVVLLEDGLLRAETCRSNTLLMKWYE